jgi:hypothetical protein
MARRLGLVDFAGQDATGLGALFAQDTGQLAGIDAGDGDDAVLLQVGRQIILATPVGGAAGRSRMTRPAA